MKVELLRSVAKFGATLEVTGRVTCCKSGWVSYVFE
jgi:hypothetical protein